MTETIPHQGPVQIHDAATMLDQFLARLARIPVARDFTPDDSLAEMLASGNEQSHALAAAVADSLTDALQFLALVEARFAVIETAVFGRPIPYPPVSGGGEVEVDDSATAAAQRPPDDNPPMEPNPYMGGG